MRGIDGIRDARADTYDDVVGAVAERVRRGLVARFGVEVGTDACAEALAWAWEHLDEVAAATNRAGLLYRVGQSRARRLRRWNDRRSGFPSTHRWVARDAPDLDDEVIDALRKLRYRERVAVLLRHGYGFTYSEIALMLGVSEAAITNHIHRGLAKLRQILENDA